MTMNPIAKMSAGEAPRALETPLGAEITIDGQRFINFGGSSYLGLAHHPDILSAGVGALDRYGTGAAIGRGHGIEVLPYLDVEVEATRYFGRDAALFLSGGYAAGFAMLPSLTVQFGAIFYDARAHFAMRQAMATSSLPCHPFDHLDPESLSTALRRQLRPGQRPLIVTDGLFSTFGSIAPLDAYASIMADYDGRLLVDESHGFGVLGGNGRGAIEHCNVLGVAAYACGSLGKAFGTCGGLALGSRDEVAGFRASPIALGGSPGLIAAAAMCAASLRLVRHDASIRVRLRTNIVHLKRGLRALGLDPGDDAVPVAGLVPKGVDLAALKARLSAEGLFVYHSHYIGAGPAGVLRCAIFADHDTAHLDALLFALARHL